MANTYKTQGIIATIKWQRKDSDSPGVPSADTLSFTLDPVAPYLFEETDKNKSKKYVLLADVTDQTILKKKDAAETDFIVDLIDSNFPKISFDVLLMLKQNRSKVEIEIDDSHHEKLVQPKNAETDLLNAIGAVPDNADDADSRYNDKATAKASVKPSSSTADKDCVVFTVVKLTVK